MCPGDGLEGEGDAGLRGLSPSSVLTTDVLRWVTGVLVFGNSKHVAESLLHKVNVLAVVLDTRGDDEALAGSDVVHDELLKASGIEVSNVVLHAEVGHTKTVEAVGSSEHKLLVVSEGVILAHVFVEVVRFLVLSTSNVCSHYRSGFEGEIDHHLEHVNGIVLDAMSLKVGALLIVIHGHITTGHLNHTVVDGLVGVFQSLKVGVLERKEGS